MRPLSTKKRINARKRKDEASLALAKGKWDKAAKLFSSLAADFPDDAQTLVRLGEVQRKRGRPAEAVRAWLAAGRRFDQAGHYLRAMAALKLVLEVEPSHGEAGELLDELHTRRFGQPAPGRAEEARAAAVQPDPVAPPATARAPQAAPPAPVAPVGMPPAVRAALATKQADAAAVVVPAGLDELLFDVDIDVEGLDDPLDLDLPEIPLFAALDPAAFRRVIARSRHLSLSPGELAVHEGERGDSFFVVIRGELEVLQGPNALHLAFLREGAFFGEMALLNGSPRSASVRARSESELLQFTASDLGELVREQPPVAAALRRFYRQRLLANALATAPLFRQLDPAARATLISRFRTREMAAGEVVVREGALAEGLFVVLHGSVEVFRGEGREERLLGRLRQGDLFGEQSLLHDRTAGATCRASTRGMLLRLPREDFAGLLDRHPAVRDYIDEVDRQRQRRNEALPHGA